MQVLNQPLTFMQRYARQIQVPKLGTSGQEKLQQASILLVGVGGLGCTVAAQLVTAGVGSITLVDHDTVSLTNLHRQWLFNENDIGLNKAVCAVGKLSSMNAQVELEAVEQRLSPQNVQHLCQNVDLVVDAADNFVVSYLLSDACQEQGKSLLSASVNQTFGYIAVACGASPSLRAFFPKPAQQLTNCDVVGVLGPSVGVIASLQAQEAIKILLDDPATLNGQICYVDTWQNSMHTIDMHNASEPEKIAFNFIGDHVLANQQMFVIDVRETAEIDASPQTFPIDRHIPLERIQQQAHQLEHGDHYALACRSGQRALIAAQSLSEQGFENISVIAPG